ncbi:MAG: tRNA (guanine-N(7)-)-methyltransferase non-catalytic subunit trm82 [Bogoriella megaspora]|nr:MAG: tRNA (guanine-N(7)-)-methyltransferase non-catalytic subunit trm82 [Bogoriella megaspora]
METSSWHIRQVWPEPAQNREAEYALKENYRREPTDTPPGKRRKISIEETKPNIIDIVASQSHRYVVAVTAEDKCIRVFELSSDGGLYQLSERYAPNARLEFRSLNAVRCMPKRPSAVSITPDEQNIVVGDKFGDVYSLPLLYLAYEDNGVEDGKSQGTPAKPYRPTATSLTVHSGANRKALEAQRQLKDHVKTKEPLKFAHKLLLGHVSMLTDLALASIPNVEGKERNYIITSDRDEHIRISRGIPQTHIIEGYCLGHTEFVNVLCLVKPEVLISGGGDNYIYVWDWLRGRLLNRVGISSAVRQIRGNSSAQASLLEDESGNEQEPSVAVSGIWLFARNGESRILIACENVPGLIEVDASSSHLTQSQPVVNFVKLPGNTLDVTVTSANDVVVAIDSYHEAGSTSVVRPQHQRPQSLQWLQLSPCSPSQSRGTPQDGSNWTVEAINLSDPTLADKSFVSNGDKVKASQTLVTSDGKAEVTKGFRELLYNVENLRKRGGTGEELG